MRMMHPSPRSSHPKYSTEPAERVLFPGFNRRRNIAASEGVIVGSPEHRSLPALKTKVRGRVLLQILASQNAPAGPNRYINDLAQAALDRKSTRLNSSHRC